MGSDLDRRLKILLKTGRLALESGADSQRVHWLLQRLADLLALDEIHLLFNYRALSATASMAGVTATRVTGIGSMGVNMRVESALGRYLHELESCPGLDQLEVELDAIAAQPSSYPRWVVLVLVGAACAAFGHLFGGDKLTMAAAGFGALVGLWLKLVLIARHQNPVLVTTVCAAVSATLAAVPAQDIGLATTASVLYLVPGVPMINALEDILQGHVNIAMGRGVVSAVHLAAIAIGLVTSLTVMGGLS